MKHRSSCTRARNQCVRGPRAPCPRRAERNVHSSKRCESRRAKRAVSANRLGERAIVCADSTLSRGLAVAGRGRVGPGRGQSISRDLG